MRNYELMRWILIKSVTSDKPLKFSDIARDYNMEDIESELKRLVDEGLIVSNIHFSCGSCMGGEIAHATKDGKMFVRNISNQKVWDLIYQTLTTADLDLSYPLIKEVCDEVVRRYVMEFIPEKLHYTN